MLVHLIIAVASRLSGRVSIRREGVVMLGGSQELGFDVVASPAKVIRRNIQRDPLSTPLR
ncbi:MAG TPA: hypothetical protein VLZ74_09150 [Methylocella sp.]|nr:hypothetical protein [Methylocella sp.]